MSWVKTLPTFYSLKKDKNQHELTVSLYPARYTFLLFINSELVNPCSGRDKLINQNMSGKNDFSLFSIYDQWNWKKVIMIASGLSAALNCTIRKEHSRFVLEVKYLSGNWEREFPSEVQWINHGDISLSDKLFTNALPSKEIKTEKF